MPFEPGESGNPNGRPKGSQNKETRTLREKIDYLLEDQFEMILKDLENLKPKERKSLAFWKGTEFEIRP